jgi:hypothetical protein
MTPALREMIREQAARSERERIVAIAQHGLALGRFEESVALAKAPSMTPELVATILAGGGS